MFNADEYWSQREYKVYLVTLTNTKGKKDFKIVRAKTQRGAIKTAVYNSQLKGKIFYSEPRLATPYDLSAK